MAVNELVCCNSSLRHDLPGSSKRVHHAHHHNNQEGHQLVYPSAVGNSS